MTLNPGATVLPGETAETRPGTDAVEAGDAVTIGNGEMTPAADTDEFAGIARHPVDNSGYGNTLILQGAIVANVATDDPDGAVTEGALLSPSPTAGALYRDYTSETDAEGNTTITYDQPGPVLALSDEGGSWHSGEQTYDVPDGYAVVYVRSM